MKCHITINRFDSLLGLARHYGVKLRFSGKECHILTIVSYSGRQVTMPSVHNFNHWKDYMSLVVGTMHALSETERRITNDNHKGNLA